MTTINNYTDANDFAIICKDEQVTLYRGTNIIFQQNTLEELEQYQEDVSKKIIFLLPFCSVAREGKGEALGDESILAMEVDEEITVSKQELLSLLPDLDIALADISPDVSDTDFEQKVLDIKAEINAGEVCQTVISREFSSAIQDYSPAMLLTAYKKLLAIDGGYMTYMYQRGDQVFTAASPEVHLRVDENEVVKAPIAGTLAKLYFETFLQRLEQFLQNPKEKNELAMVVDEELKMMMKIADGGKISPLQLREIAAVIHTEYILSGKPKPDMSPIDMLRETLFSPTLVGGPLESAYKQIAKHENGSRRYYGTVFGVYDGETLDTCIPIRAAEIDRETGNIAVRAGAGVVSGSDPIAEADETVKKSNGFFAALKNTNSSENYLENLSNSDLALTQQIMTLRDLHMSDFYFDRYKYQDLRVPEIQGKTIAIISNGDNFSYMIEYMLQNMGGNTQVIENNGDDMIIPDSDLVILGPGYGDINNADDPKMTQLLSVTEKLETQDQKILGVCLGHQALCKNAGLDIERQKYTYPQLETPVTQGEQIQIEKFGRVGMYNSFSPKGNTDVFDDSVLDPDGRILYQKSGNTVSSQFHPESVMSENGFEILKNMVLEVI
ncbi:chorismate-binding protein [Candidatus Gracilibacteria bacterium]|nr:chorismate-binding protein [Candidatus Gracilibacteria bacterium]